MKSHLNNIFNNPRVAPRLKERVLESLKKSGALGTVQKRPDPLTSFVNKVKGKLETNFPGRSIAEVQRGSEVNIYLQISPEEATNGFLMEVAEKIWDNSQSSKGHQIKSIGIGLHDFGKGPQELALSITIGNEVIRALSRAAA